MSNNIFILPIGGGEELEELSLNVTENGSYTAAEGTAYTNVTVNVPDIPAVTEPLNVTVNGTYTAPEGIDGYREVTVNVPQVDVSVVSKINSVTVLGYYSIQANIYVGSNQTITSCGVEVSTTEDFAEVASYASTSNTNGDKNVHVTGLNSGTTYYIRSYVIVNGVNYNKEQYNTSTTFETPVVPESIPVTATKMVTANTDTVNLKFRNTTPDEVVYIDWGDGLDNSTRINANIAYGYSGGTVSHTYSEAGVYDIYIWSESSTDTTYGKMPSFFANNSDMKIARIETPLQNIYNGSTRVTAGTISVLQNAFYGCTSLEYVCPTLLDNVHYYSDGVCNVNKGCYTSMFSGCTSLTSVPELPATRLADNCYSEMFKGCTSLTAAPVLPATTLADYCYDYMFQDCTSLTEAPVLPATKLDPLCYRAMFYRCTSLTEAPVLPATTLAYCCYQYMFHSCSSIESVTTYVTNWNTEYTSYWLYNAGTNATNPTVYCPSDSTIPSNNDAGIPTGWTRADLEI